MKIGILIYNYVWDLLSEKFRVWNVSYTYWNLSKLDNEKFKVKNYRIPYEIFLQKAENTFYKNFIVYYVIVISEKYLQKIPPTVCMSYNFPFTILPFNLRYKTKYICSMNFSDWLTRSFRYTYSQVLFKVTNLIKVKQKSVVLGD